jgi:hypothetical protein
MADDDTQNPTMGVSDSVSSTPESNSSAVEPGDGTYSPEVEAQVEAGLNKLQDLGNPDPEATETQPDPEAASTEPAVGETEESPKETQDQQPAVKAGPTVPDAYRRSLKAYDWSDAEIDAGAKADPAAFLVMAQRIHANRNAEMARWAEMGRTQRQGNAGTNPQNQPQIVNGQLKPIDIAAMTEKYGNEDLVKDMATPLNAAIEQINRLLPDLMTGVSAIQQSRTNTLAQQIDQFFGRPELATFKPVYGTDHTKLEGKQFEARNKVLEMADALIAGAGAQGRNLSVEEALLMAHDATSGSFKTEAIRASIKKDVKARSQGLSLRPGKAGTSASDNGPPRSKAELESRTRGRLAAVFGNS